LPFSHYPAAQSNQDSATERECDISSLLEMLASVTDPRKARGRQYTIGFVLAVTVVAALAGARNYSEIARRARDISQVMLMMLGSQWDWHRRCFRCPSKTVIRNVLAGLDGDEMDRIAGKWLFENSGRERGREWEIAFDGKVMRGAWTAGNGKVTLFSAMTHREAVTIAQVSVPAETNETTQASTLLKALDTLGIPEENSVLVTLDAAHTCQETAREVKKRKQLDYLMNVKGNRPGLQAAVFAKLAPLTLEEPGDIITERARGQIRKWSCWITRADGVTFPSASQVALIRRDVLEVSGQPVSKEIALMITSRKPGKMTAADLNRNTRNHWRIENKSHYIRDTVYREDHNQTWAGNGHHALAITHNLAISLLRLKDVKAIKETTEWIAADRTRALKFMAT
jgi:predicted transposase YbfD/YdcC